MKDAGVILRHSPLPLDPGELFQHGADRAGVLAAAALRDASMIELRRGGEERRRTMEVGGEFADDVEVLQMSCSVTPNLSDLVPPRPATPDLSDLVLPRPVTPDLS